MAMEGRIEARTGTVQRLMSALEQAGVQFIPENGGGPGVRLRAPARGSDEGLWPGQLTTENDG